MILNAKDSKFCLLEFRGSQYIIQFKRHEILLAVATKIIFLTWLPDLSLKQNKFRLRQQSIPSAIYMFKVSKKTKTKQQQQQQQQKSTRIMCQIYSRLTIKTPEQRLAPLLLTLNIFLTLFYCYYCWIRTKKMPVEPEKL